MRSRIAPLAHRSRDHLALCLSDLFKSIGPACRLLAPGSELLALSIAVTSGAVAVSMTVRFACAAAFCRGRSRSSCSSTRYQLPLARL